MPSRPRFKLSIGLIVLTFAAGGCYTWQPLRAGASDRVRLLTADSQRIELRAVTMLGDSTIVGQNAHGEEMRLSAQNTLSVESRTFSGPATFWAVVGGVAAAYVVVLSLALRSVSNR